MKCISISIKGIVQGIGFRPFVYNLADRFGLKGFVRNDGSGVTIEVEGSEERLALFLQSLKRDKPQPAFYDEIIISDLPLKGYENFCIMASEGGEINAWVTPDLALCEDCLQELKNPDDRRYEYPFINCTNCGPRFTIIKNVPYDRLNTTMTDFMMCENCKAEYINNENRRFHAQPNACSVCGPKIWLTDRENNGIEGKVWENIHTRLNKGEILALKGLGGFHLACDALNEEAVYRLRQRKCRWEKPFAIMVPDLQTANEYCYIDKKEQELLTSSAHPIVLLKIKANNALAPSVAPDNKRLGIMLPYTPIHHLLMQKEKALVMTSANVSDEPIVYNNKEALKRLSKIADFFLMHNRDIYRRCDDSVAVVVNGETILIRRARGYTPLLLPLSKTGLDVLAFGAQQKNTFCYTKGNKAYLSQYIGDLDNPAAFASYKWEIAEWQKLFQAEPQFFVCDSHPDYVSTLYAKNTIAEDKLLSIQHHHAHIASCMAENEYNGEVIGVAFDGTGYGEDGKIWGGEFFIGGYQKFYRMAHFEYIPMATGEKAIKEPWRMALSYLSYYWTEKWHGLPAIQDFVSKMPEEWQMVQQALDSGLNSPLTSSMGRLFDAVSAYLGLCLFASYEGQGAVLLENAIQENIEEYYNYYIDTDSDVWQISLADTWRELVSDKARGESTGIIAARFHNTIAALVMDTAVALSALSGIRTVALSGGVWQNIYLLEKTKKILEEAGFKVLIHHKVPTNDSGIAYGQAAMAMYKLKGEG